jgi:hypothetical protein
VSLETEYASAAREMLASHLVSAGLKARVSEERVATGIDGISVDFEVESLEPSDDLMQLVFWAIVDGVDGLEPPTMRLDLVGHGPDGHAALANGLHVFFDGVIPVLQVDIDRSLEPPGVKVVDATSVTGDGTAVSWDLILGPVGIGAEDRATLQKAVDDLVLIQGIFDSFMAVFHERRPHWLKLLLGRAPSGEVIGTVRLDGTELEFADSFKTAQWPAGSSGIIRQFVLARPTSRLPDAATVAELEALHGRAPRKSWWHRLGRGR